MPKRNDKYSIVPTSEDYVKELSLSMRKPDVEEIWAAGHLTPKQAIFLSLGVSSNDGTALVNGKVMCMFGVGMLSILSNIGVPWMLGTSLMDEHAHHFLRKSRKWINKVKEEYPLLINYVDARNVMSIRWLKWMGFKMFPAEPYGAQGLPFHRFEMRRE